MFARQTNKGKYQSLLCSRKQLLRMTRSALPSVPRLRSSTIVQQVSRGERSRSDAFSALPRLASSSAAASMLGKEQESERERELRELSASEWESKMIRGQEQVVGQHLERGQDKATTSSVGPYSVCASVASRRNRFRNNHPPRLFYRRSFLGPLLLSRRS